MTKLQQLHAEQAELTKRKREIAIAIAIENTRLVVAEMRKASGQLSARPRN